MGKIGSSRAFEGKVASFARDGLALATKGRIGIVEDGQTFPGQAIDVIRALRRGAAVGEQGVEAGRRGEVGCKKENVMALVPLRFCVSQTFCTSISWHLQHGQGKSDRGSIRPS